MPTIPACRFTSHCTREFRSATGSWLLFNPTSQPSPDHRATPRRLARCQAEGQPTWLENAAAPDAQSPVPEGSLERLPPWNLSFDIRERETDWTDENKARLVTIIASRELGEDNQATAARLEQLLQILPNFSARLSTMRPWELADLLRDIPLVAERLLQLRDLLPHMDVARLASQQPNILLKEPQDVVRETQRVGSLLGLSEDRTQAMLQEQPRFLDAEAVEEVLGELQRLMPKQDNKRFLINNPDWITKVERGPKRLGPHPDDI